MMTPLGYGQRPKYLDDPDSDDADEYSQYYETSGREKPKPVPIWLCVFLVISYILGCCELPVFNSLINDFLF